MEGGVLEVVRGALVRVLPCQREDSLVGGDEVGHPGDGANNERLAGGVQVRLGPRQHPHARRRWHRRRDRGDGRRLGSGERRLWGRF